MTYEPLQIGKWYRAIEGTRRQGCLYRFDRIDSDGFVVMVERLSACEHRIAPASATTEFWVPHKHLSDEDQLK
jgi:hypothetical protein